MNSRDDLLFYAAHLSDQRIHRMVGKCLAEGSRQAVAAEPEVVTPTTRTAFAAILPDLPDAIVDDILSIAKGAREADPEQLRCMDLVLRLPSKYAQMVRVAAEALYDIHCQASQPQEEEEAAV